MNLEDFLDVMEMHDPQTLIIKHGQKTIIITGDDELQQITARQKEHEVVKISPCGNGIIVRID